ncbi:MAG: hypothetical protein ACRC4W_02920, partial [Treponemataceae bacterium]
MKKVGIQKQLLLVGILALSLIAGLLGCSFEGGKAGGVLEFAGGKEVAVALEKEYYQVELSKAISGVIIYKSLSDEVALVDGKGKVQLLRAGVAEIEVKRLESATEKEIREVLKI